MILNEFDAYQEALKKVNLNEEVMPIYRGRLLTENVELYCKIQKLLNCPAMEQCHRWLYDLDVENLDESECSKINNLFQLGLDKGYIDDDTADDADIDAVLSSDAQGTAEPQLPVTDPAPVINPPQPAPEPKQEAPMAAFTVVYSATRDGQIKTGEAYSNSLNTRSAKADVISKLEKAGYQNISILAIEAGDPDMTGCDNTFCKKSDYEPPAYEDEEVEEADHREPLAHAFHPFGMNASTANTSGQDEVKMTLTEDEAKAEVKKAFDEVNKQVTEDPEAEEIKKFLADNKEKLEELRSLLDDKGAKCFDKLYDALTKYANGQLGEDEEVDEAKGASGKRPSTGIKSLIRGIFKILLTLLSLSGSAFGLTGKIVTWAGNLLATGCDRLNAKLKESEPVSEARIDASLKPIIKAFKQYNNKTVDFDWLSDEVEDDEHTSHRWMKTPDGIVVCAFDFDGETVDYYIVDNRNNCLVKVGNSWTGGGDFEYAGYGDNDTRPMPKDKPPVTEAGEDEDGGDDAEDDSGSDEASEDSDDAGDDEGGDDSSTEDSGEDGGEGAEDEDKGDEKAEGAEEPDEKLKADKKAEDGKEDATDDKEEKELTDQEKSQLRDSYKKAFKAAMQKCKMFGKCFDDLTLEEKVEFFTELQKAWGDKADPSKFMSDKEVEALQKIVVKKQ